MTIKNFLLKIILWLTLFILLVGVIYGSFIVWRINQTENQLNNTRHTNFSLLDTVRGLVLPVHKNELKHTTENRINILFLGIAGPHKSGANLTDTIMIASINTQTNQVALLSIPRDLYVNIPQTDRHTKINSLYQYGLKQTDNDLNKALEPLKKTLKNITSLNIDYWLVMDFAGFKQIVDALGGINITNQRDIYDSHYPGPNYSYETFQLKKGFQHLDGATALKYARMRHNDPEGDFGRAKRQQQILQAIKNKIFSTGTLLNVTSLNKLFVALGNNLKTNIQPDEFDDFLDLLKKLDTQNINNVVLDAWKSSSLLIVSHVFYGSIRSFVLIPRLGNWKETRELAQNIFQTNQTNKRHQKIIQEKASLVLINKSGHSVTLTRIKHLLKYNFNYKNIIVISDPQTKKESTTRIYDLTEGNKPFTLDELTKILTAEITSPLSSHYKDLLTHINADLVIVIGENSFSRYNMSQDSLEDYKKVIH